LDLGSRVNEGIDESVAIREKREQILEGAMQVFLSHGYAGTSMDRAAAAAGVSKQTIYSHFQDKEGLFTALIERVTIQRMQFDVHVATSQDDAAALMRQLAEVFLQKMTDDEYLSLFRVVIAESVRFPELAQLYTRTVIQKGQLALSTYFKSHPELNIADPEAIARIFWGSLVSFLVSQEILYGKLIIPMEQDRLVNNLIALILKQT
jgi:AcrR family transcriptional regulator